MSIDELIAVARSTEVSDRTVEMIESQLAQAEDEFEKEALAKSVGEDFLSRAYSL